MTEPTIRNAIIKSATITNGDHGVLTAWLNLDFGSSGQGFGGYVLHQPHENGGRADESTRNRARASSPNIGGLFIWRVLEIVGVSDWSQLPGKTIRAVQTFSKVEAIGHIINDTWFNPGQEIEALIKEHDSVHASKANNDLVEFVRLRFQKNGAATISMHKTEVAQWLATSKN
jgi:hypothetical protein